MALLASGRVSKSLQRKSRGLADPYDVPLSPPMRRSPLRETHVPGHMRRLNPYSHKRLKAALRPGGRLDDRTLDRRHTRDDGLYGYGYQERAPKRQKSVQVETQMNLRMDESVPRAESALDDITDKTKNHRLMDVAGMALERLFMGANISSIAGSNAAPCPARKDRRVTWEENIGSRNATSKTAVGGDPIPATVFSVDNHARIEPSLNEPAYETDTHMPEAEPAANDEEDSATSLRPAIPPSEDLTTAEYDIILHNTEHPMGNRTSERGDRNVDVAVRASIPYPASLLLDTDMDAETENTTVDRPSERFPIEMNAEIANPPVSCISGGFDTDVMDTEVSYNDTGTGWGGIESIQEMRTDETGHTEYLVRWEGVDDESTTWEPEETMLSSAPVLLFQYLKAIIFSRSKGEQELGSSQKARNHQLVRDNEETRDEPAVTDEPAVREEPAVKRGRGRPRGRQNLKGRRMLPALTASMTSGNLKSLDSRIRRRPSHLLGSSMTSKNPSIPTTSQLSTDIETPSTVVKRGRGRPRGSGKSKPFAQVSRRTTATSLEDTETSALSKAPGNREDSRVALTRRQSRLAGNRDESPRNDFFMPAALEILEAAEKLEVSRDRLKDFALGTQIRPGRPVGSRNKPVCTISDQLAENPYKKQYITGESNRGLKLPPATYSAFAIPPRGIMGFSMPTPTKILEAARKLKASGVGTKKRRGRPPGSRNKNVRAGYANLLPSRRSTPALTSEGTQKRGRGRPRGSRNKSSLFEMGQFYHRISKRRRQKRFRRWPPLSFRLRD